MTTWSPTTPYAQWTASGRDPELLLRGSALEQARTWFDARPGELPGELAEFVRLSDRTQQQRLTRDRRRVRLLAILLALAVAFGSFAVIQAERARQQARLATSRSLAAHAERLADRQSDLAQLLSLASLHTAPTREAWASVQTTLSRPLHPCHQLSGHTDAVTDVAFSPDGRLLATASGDRTVRLWDVATRQPVGEPLTGHTDEVLSVAFSLDGKFLATASADYTVRLWDVANRQPLGDPFTGHADWVIRVAFSPDGRLLATASANRTVRLWDMVSRQPVGEPLTGHAGPVLDVAFSPDGRLLATASRDRTARLWAIPATWIGHSCELVGRNLSQEEWDRYVGAGTPYGRQCAQYPSGPCADPRAPAAVYPASP